MRLNDWRLAFSRDFVVLAPADKAARLAYAPERGKPKQEVHRTPSFTVKLCWVTNMSNPALRTITTAPAGGHTRAQLAEKELEQACTAALAELEALLQGKGPQAQWVAHCKVSWSAA